jgi:2-isopropylmalate synthase
MDKRARITLLDSTLRDGAQGEGISFSVADKLGIVEALDELGVDYIEAGNPGSNPKDAEFFKLARNLKLANSSVVAFGSTKRRDVIAKNDIQLRSLLDADTETVVIFGKSWDFHVERVLGASLPENLDMIRESVAFLKAEGRRVILDAEHFFDGYAANPAYALECLGAAIDGGTECLVLCDTNGGSLPSAVTAGVGAALSLVNRIKPGLGIGIHAHNDSGLAVANSLAAVEAGAVHVQGVLAGFGERCGNANLSTIAANLRFKMSLDCLREDSLPGLTKAVRRVAGIANISIDEGMPYVGLHAFAHKAGMHIDAVLKSPKSFEHVNPESVGGERRFLASEVGGRSVVMERLKTMMPQTTKSDPAVHAAVARLKEMEQLGYQYEGAEASLDLLLRKSSGAYVPFFELIRYRTTGERTPTEGTHVERFSGSHAMVQLSVGGIVEIQAAEGDGPVHALDIALRKALARFYPSLAGMRLADFKVRVLDGGDATAATVRVLIESADSSGAWTTVGVSTDIIEASWIALVDSIEYKLYRDGAKVPVQEAALSVPAEQAV